MTSAQRTGDAEGISGNSKQFTQFNAFHVMYCSTGPCDKMPDMCQNGATCVNVGEDDFLCICPYGYKGITCDTGAKSIVIVYLKTSE